ncbi:MAG TPA: YiaA/YiaB family inner membrane protein [Trichocoleus sp.]
MQESPTEMNYEDVIMSSKNVNTPVVHTTAWIAQTWLSFVIALTATSIGILYMPMNAWMKGYLGMGMLFSVGSTISLSKTLRDVEESKRMLSRIDEAKLERLLAEYDPFKK